MIFSEEVARLIATHIPLSVSAVLELLEEPPEPEMGHIAFPCFSLAKEMKQSPAKIAENLSQAIKPEMPIERIETKGPYLNIFLNTALLTEHILSKKMTVLKRKQKVMIEHSNGNTHKSVHIGHLRNLFLGDSLVRIVKAAGYSVVNSYYINDTGAMVARCLWAVMNKHKGEEPQNNKLQWLGKAYQEGVAELEARPELKEEMDEVLQKLESGDSDIQKLWKTTRQWSIDDWHRIFEQLRMLPFDARFYDSEVIKDVKAIIDDMHEKGILQSSEGALIANLEDYGLNIAVMRKRDGTTPYLAKDLALADKKFGDYQIDKSVYVVGSEQELHFQQLFKLLELHGFKQAKNCYHLSYGLVMLASGKMSSREGTTILFDDFYKDIYDHAEDEIKKRHEDWTEKKIQQRAQDITLGAMKLPMINQDPIKRIIFDIRSSLDFEGETGPYLQYSYARLCSVLRKYGKKVSNNVDFTQLSGAEEQSLIKLLGKEQDIVVDAAEKYKPSIVARYALDIAQATNSFYHACPILSEEETLRKSRLYLVLKSQETLKRVLELLGIPTPEDM